MKKEGTSPAVRRAHLIKKRKKEKRWSERGTAMLNEDRITTEELDAGMSETQNDCLWAIAIHAVLRSPSVWAKWRSGPGDW